MILVFLLGTSAYAESNRIAGSDRYSTAVEISKSGWDQANTVVIVIGDNFPDALAGGPLAYKRDAPILLTGKESLNSKTKTEINRLGATKAVILGGTSVITESVETELKNMGLQIERIGGRDRYATAALIAEQLGNTDKAIVVYGGNYPDALAVAPYAAKNGYPILLSETKQIPSMTLNKVKGKKEVLFIGGNAILHDSLLSKVTNAKRIAGSGRYSTAVEIAKKLPLGGEGTFLATGQGFADSLTGSVLAAKSNAALLLVEPSQIPSSVLDVLKKNYTEVTILGGQSVVSQTIESAIRGKQPVKLHKNPVNQEDGLPPSTEEEETEAVDPPSNDSSEEVQSNNNQDQNRETDVPVYEPSRDFEVKGVAIGDTVEEVINKVGQPIRKDLGYQGQEWYVYNNDHYKEYFQIGIMESKVISLYTSTDVLISKIGLKIGQTKQQVASILGVNEDRAYSVDGYYCSFFYDEIGGDTLSAVLISADSIYEYGRAINNVTNIERLRESYERSTFDLVNSFRVRHNLHTLQWDDKANMSARLHSMDMAEKDYFSHTNLDGIDPFQRMKDQGIDFYTAGENIAAGQHMPFFAHNDWVNSMGHRLNMLSGDYEKLGVGVGLNLSSRYVYYYTQNFYK